jgi:hypothetical protein
MHGAGGFDMLRDGTAKKGHHHSAGNECGDSTFMSRTPRRVLRAQAPSTTEPTPSLAKARVTVASL